MGTQLPGDAALCQITLTTCYYHYIDTYYVYITIIISQFAARRKASRDNLSSVTKLNGRTVITVAVVRKAKLVFKNHSSVYSPDTTKAESKREGERERESRHSDLSLTAHSVLLMPITIIGYCVELPMSLQRRPRPITGVSFFIRLSTTQPL